MAELAEASQYAADSGRDVWDFAMEIRALRAVGLTDNDFRWLICKEYVRHARETTPPGGSRRSFEPADELRFSERSCFVLTEAGLGRAVALPHAAAPPDANGNGQGSAGGNGNGDAAHAAVHVLPVWDPVRRELRLKGKLVKQFRVPSPNQEALLSAFQEEGWPPRIDDPLPRNGCHDHKRRLHDTIKSLNRKQKHRLIRIKGDGTGEGVLWEPMPDLSGT
jgi:hypothetical protein